MSERFTVQLDHPHVVCDPPARALRLLDYTVTNYARDHYRPRRPNRCRQFGAKHRMVTHTDAPRAARCRRCGLTLDSINVSLQIPPLDLPEITFR